MEIKELPKINDVELTENEKENLFNNIIRGKDVTEKIETSRGVFEVKYPRVDDLEKIGRILAYKLGNATIDTMDKGIYALMSQTATLDVIVLSGPAWFENAKKETNFTWSDIPLESFISEVYAKAYKFRIEVQNILEGNTQEGNKGMVTNNNNVNVDKPSLFEGLADSTE